MTRTPTWITDAAQPWDQYVAEVARANESRGTTSATDPGLVARNAEVQAAARAGVLNDQQVADMIATITAPSFARLIIEIDNWYSAHGTWEIPQKATVELDDGTTLRIGRAVNSLREDYAAGRLDPGRIVALEQRSEWVWSLWDGRLLDLQRYIDEHGSIDGLPQRDKVLYRWVLRQRDYELPPERREQLQELLDSRWPATRQAPVADFVEQMTAWAAEHPKHDVNRLPTTPDGARTAAEARLGRRASYYRSRYRSQQLAPDAIEKISQIPGWRWPR